MIPSGEEFALHRGRMLMRTIASCLLFAALVLAGCASAPKVDWNSRVGTYTYDQAVLELGPPDRSSSLADGTTVAEWFVAGSRGGVSFGLGTGISSGNVGVYGGPTISSGGGRRVLRLTFGPDRRLSAVKRLSP
jgi:hypothetical protein